MRLKEFANLVGFEITSTKLSEIYDRQSIGLSLRTPEHTFFEHLQCRFSIWDGARFVLRFFGSWYCLKKYLMTFLLFR